MSTGSLLDEAAEESAEPEAWQAGDVASLARNLVEKVGFEGAVRYCRSLGWRGVLDQVERLRHSY